MAASQSAYNNDNQLTSRTTGSGPVLFAGSISRQGTVTVAGNAATMNHFTTNFTAYPTLSGGSNAVQVIATDYGNHSRTNNYGIIVTNNGVAETLSYDANGNLTNVVTTTWTNSYQWDAANRLISVTSPTNSTLFTYDGLGRRVQIIEATNGVAYATNKFVWDGTTLCEQRDSTGASVTKRFFGEGEQVSGTNYFFTRDHLGSVREVTSATGVTQARYDYDPYGRMTTVLGTFNADFGYAGMYVHWPSGLNLTLYRAYNPDLGRWPNRDPIQELGGLNLYAYVANNPINKIDPLGLEGNPVSSTLPGMSGAWNSNPYGSGGSFYGPGYLYKPGCPGNSDNPFTDAWNFMMQHGSIDLTLNASNPYNRDGLFYNLELNSEGLFYQTGVGRGLGEGVSLTGNLNFGNSPGFPNVATSFAGGDEFGGTATYQVSPSGGNLTIGLGGGVGAGGTVTTATPQVPIIKF